MIDKILKFKVDTKHRKNWFTGVSFSHPAKMSLPLQLWIIENFTKVGETILDPMAGSGTILVACSMGRNVIAVELEQKFIDIINGNWEKIKQRGAMMGYQFGQAQILQGDSRNLEGLLVDKCIFSPPYAEMTGKGLSEDQIKLCEKTQGRRFSKASWRSATDYSDDPSNIGNLPYGQVDKIVTSPPYEEAMGDKHHSPRADKLAQEKSNPTTYTDKVDAVITSPPYEGSVTGKDGIDWDKAKQSHWKEDGFAYSNTKENIGNLKSTSYLEAMLQVYQQCYRVLKLQGLMILVVKPFIRDQKLVPLQEDTKRLCEQAGFLFLEEYHRILSSQSFWRVIYAKRYPLSPKIDREYVLVFRKK